MGVRRAAVAGSWYPGSATRLTAEVERYLAGAEAETEPRDERPAPVALFCPHAGLIYSGPVAAHGYRLLAREHYDAIVLVGPSHFVGFDGVSVWPSGAFETPLGLLTIDADLAGRLLAACPIVHQRPAAHAREHSLEMQTPFLATLAPETPIVPLVMGHQTRETAFALADALAAVVADRDVLLVASSDLSHYFDAATAASLDAVVVDAVARLDAEGLMALLEARPDHACGGGPMVSVLAAARQIGASHSRVLKYADSGDVSGDKGSVVGYMSAALWR